MRRAAIRGPFPSGPAITTLQRYLVRESIHAGAPLFSEGDSGSCLYTLTLGEITVSVRLQMKHGRTLRLATYGPGVILGKMAGAAQHTDGTATTS